jgi:hypothetical protein
LINPGKYSLSPGTRRFSAGHGRAPKSLFQGKRSGRNAEGVYKKSRSSNRAHPSGSESRP